MTEALPLVLRGVAVGLALALLLAATGQPRRARRALAPLLVCLAAYVLRAAPQARDWPPGALLPLSIGALAFPLAFWWLVHSAFEDRADVPWPAWAAAAAMVAAGLFGGDAAHVVQKAIAAGFVGAALWRLWRSRADDLVARRRTLRSALLAYIGAHGLAVLAVELWLRGAAPPAWLDVLNVAVITLALAVTLVWLAGLRGAAVDALFGPDAAPPAPRPAPADDTPWLARLDALMTREHAYRDPALTLAALAQRLGLPEYRLRELIHRRLGFRNFPAFVNTHRLREVEQRLADPACDRQPILTLALEAGFGSIGPFNRAFRERHGIAPSEFRGRRDAQPAA